MIEHPRIRIISGKDTYHMDFDENMEESDIEALLSDTGKSIQWHLENRNDHRHYPIYLNQLSKDAYQISGAISGLASKEHTGPQRGLWVANIQFFDYYKRQIKDKLLPEGSIAYIYDKLIAIYKDEIEIPAYEKEARYLLYASVNEKGQLAYIYEKRMADANGLYEDTPQFKHRASNLTDISKELNWMPKRIPKPNEPGVYQIAVNAKWSPLSSRTIEVLSCTPICIF